MKSDLYAMSLEQEIYMILYAESDGWNPYNFGLFMSGGPNPQDWLDQATDNFVRRFSNNSQMRVISYCIKRNIEIALVSPSPYVRKYSQLVIEKANDEA